MSDKALRAIEYFSSIRWIVPSIRNYRRNVRHPAFSVSDHSTLTNFCSRYWKWFGIGIMSGVSGAVLLQWDTGFPAVQCKSFDMPTPQYLIPFYLRDVGSHFRHYASIKNGKELSMTVEDLVCALLALPSRGREDAHLATPKLRALFAATDEDMDGTISFSEFRVLAALLQLQGNNLPVLFRLADKEEKGFVTLKEFATILYGATRDNALYHQLVSPKARQNNGLLQHLLGGSSSPQRCTEDDIRRFVREVEEQLWEADFRRFGSNGKIRPSQFVQLIASHVLGTHPPYYLEANIQRLQKTGAAYGDITLPMWMAFNRVMKAAEDVSDVFAFFGATGNAVSKENIGRVLRAAGIDDLPPATADILFAVFDKNGDGKVDLEECLSVVGLRRQFYYQSGSSRSSSIFPTRAWNCVEELFS